MKMKLWNCKKSFFQHTPPPSRFSPKPPFCVPLPANVAIYLTLGAKLVGGGAQALVPRKSHVCSALSAFLFCASSAWLKNCTKIFFARRTHKRRILCDSLECTMTHSSERRADKIKKCPSTQYLYGLQTIFFCKFTPRQPSVYAIVLVT